VLRLQRTPKDSTLAKGTPPSLVLSAKAEGIEDRRSPSSAEGARLPATSLPNEERPLASPHLFKMATLEGIPTRELTEEAGEPPIDLPLDSGVGLGVQIEGSSSLGDGTGQGEGRPLRVLAGYQVLPRYPLIARREGLEGTTLLRVQIKADGELAKVLILQSSGHPSLDEAAVEAVSLWRFRFEGEAPQGGVWARLPVRFVLSGP
jgi:protein TonB